MGVFLMKLGVVLLLFWLAIGLWGYYYFRAWERAQRDSLVSECNALKTKVAEYKDLVSVHKAKSLKLQEEVNILKDQISLLEGEYSRNAY